MGHPELGLEIMRRFADAMSEVANVEKPAKLEGRTMLMFLAPQARQIMLFQNIPKEERTMPKRKRTAAPRRAL